MQHVLILIGVSGSGKTTYAREFVQQNPTYLRLNRDDLRRSLLAVPLNDYWKWDAQRKNPVERVITATEKTALMAALDGGWNVILDNTHLRHRTIKDLLKQVANRPVMVTFKPFDIPLTEAIRRDAARPDTVGELVIQEQFGRYEQLKNQFNTTQTLIFPRVYPLPDKPAAQEVTLPKCILVDIDGTVALMANRSPFEWRKVCFDVPRQPVINVVKAMRAAGYAIIFLSGRDSAARADTIDWLQKHTGWQEGHDYTLFMRHHKDNRQDALIKRELFDTHIRGRYYVDVVFDDRDQVVSLWRRELGLTCLQVDYGNF